MLEDIGDTSTDEIPIPNVSSHNPVDLGLPVMVVLDDAGLDFQVNESVLRKVIEWCTHHKGDPTPVPDDDADTRKKSTDIPEWDQKFMQVDQEMLFEIILVR